MSIISKIKSLFNKPSKECVSKTISMGHNPGEEALFDYHYDKFLQDKAFISLIADCRNCPLYCDRMCRQYGEVNEVTVRICRERRV